MEKKLCDGVCLLFFFFLNYGLHVKEYLKPRIKVSIHHIFPEHPKFDFRDSNLNTELSTSGQRVKQLPGEFV